jgi:outer membrane lipoprotein-sorting protein
MEIPDQPQCAKVRFVRRLRRILLLLILGAVALPVLVAVAGPANDTFSTLKGGAKLNALIEAVVERQNAVRTLRAEFVQIKRSELLLEAVESTGAFTYRAPDLVRWDYHQPDAMVVLFADDIVTTFHPQEARAERIKISKKQRRFVRVLAGTQPLDDLKTHFSILLADPGGEAPFRLTLRPMGAMLKKKLRSVEIEVDRTLLLPVMVEYNEADGDSTRYQFNDLVINPEVDDSRFRLEFGIDVQVETIDATVGAG